MTFHTVTYCKKANKNIIIIHQHSRILPEGLGQSYKWKKWETSAHWKRKKLKSQLKLKGMWLRIMYISYKCWSISKYQLQLQPTVYRQVTDRLPTAGQHVTDSRPSAIGGLLPNCRPTVSGGERFFTITKETTWSKNSCQRKQHDGRDQARTTDPQVESPIH